MLTAALLAPVIASQVKAAGGQIYVTTVPEDGAAILCNGQLQGQSPLTISDLHPGPHLLVARKSGYTETRVTVVLENDERTTQQITMAPVTGLLIVDSTPAGAEIMINDTPRGKTPRLFTELSVRQYRLKLTLPGYLPYEDNITIANRVPVRHHIPLVSNTATLRVTTEPPGAFVVVDGLNRGRTPCIINDMPARQSTINVTADGYEPITRELTLTPGQDEALSLMLTALPAELTVLTEPAGARIFIDDNYSGTSPFTRTDMRPATYQIRAQHEGYRTITRPVKLERGGSITSELRLPLDSGALEITTQPAAVRVFVNGKERGETPAPDDRTDRISLPLSIMRLPNEPHQVRLVKLGYYEQDFEITIANNATITIHKEMARRFIPDFEIVTADAVVKGMFVERLPDGSVRIEVSPGIFETIGAAKIRQQRPIRLRETTP